MYIPALKHASSLRKVFVSLYANAQTNAWTGANFNRLILIIVTFNILYWTDRTRAKTHNHVIQREYVSRDNANKWSKFLSFVKFGFYRMFNASSSLVYIVLEVFRFFGFSVRTLCNRSRCCCCSLAGWLAAGVSGGVLGRIFPCPVSLPVQGFAPDSAPLGLPCSIETLQPGSQLHRIVYPGVSSPLLFPTVSFQV